MQNKPLISILIVTYNPWEYLRNTLRSCIEQSYENTEILILDNASSEDIAGSITGLQDYRITEKIEKWNEIIFRYCEAVELWSCRTVKLIKSNTNLGPYRWLNHLLEQAKWDYIAIQDHDDIWHTEKLQKQVEFLESHPEYVGCGTNTIMYYEADQKYFEYYLGQDNYYTIHPSLLFRYDGQFRYDTSGTEYMCDAYSLKYNLCHGEKKIANIREPLTLHLIKKTSGNYSYRWHKLNMSNMQLSLSYGK
jgi:glycosyltransferase involved in cell wall biosynthesis